MCVLVIASLVAYLAISRWTGALSLQDPLWLLVAIAWSLGCAEGFAFLAQPEVSARDLRIVGIAAGSVAALAVALYPLGPVLLGPTVILAL